MKSIMLSDSDLIRLYLDGDESALKTLILRHEQKIFTYILSSVKSRELAEDLFQDTFIKVINTLRAGAYKDEGKFAQWVMLIENVKIYSSCCECHSRSVLLLFLP